MKPATITSPSEVALRSSSGLEPVVALAQSTEPVAGSWRATSMRRVPPAKKAAPSHVADGQVPRRHPTVMELDQLLGLELRGGGRCEDQDRGEGAIGVESTMANNARR